MVCPLEVCRTHIVSKYLSISVRTISILEMLPNKLPTLFIDNAKECDIASEGAWPQPGEPTPVSTKTQWGVEGWLFSIVYLCPQWQVLNKAKNRIQELEQTLDNLLKLKGNRSPSAIHISFPGKDGLLFPVKAEKLG